jgi:3-oxoadipate enol-lactonase
MLLKTNDAKTYFDVVGPASGETVCLAHALLADGGMWAQQVGPLAVAGYRVLRVDLRGHGGSAGSGAPCSVADLARDFLDVFDHLEIERLHFVGLSIGGVIGQEIAVRQSQRLFSLTLSDTNPATPAGAAAMWEERLQVVRTAGSTAPLVQATMERCVTAGLKQRRPDIWAAIRGTMEATSPEGLYTCAHALQHFDFSESLSRVSVPTMVLCGSDDPATPPSEAKKIANLIPDSKYLEISDARHFPNVEHGESYAKILLDWLHANRPR